MKKFAPHILIGLAVLVVVIVGIVVFTVGKKNNTNANVTPTPTKKKVSKPVNQIPFEERPYVLMAPSAGREVDVNVIKIPKAADSVEYLAEYQFGTSLGGNEQFIDLQKGEHSKQFALYSRSAGGKTSYEEDVQGGTLRLDFAGQNAYSLQQEWKYIDNKNKQTTFASKDGKFSVASKDLGTIRYGIIYNSPGLPEDIEGNRISEVYTLAFSAPSAVKKAEVTIVTTTGATDATIMGWTGKEWRTYEASMNGNTATASVDFNEAYVVVSK